MVADKQRKVRESANFFEYLGLVLFQDNEEVVLVVYPESDKSSLDESMFIMTEIGNAIGHVAYKTVSWRYLFET